MRTEVMSINEFLNGKERNHLAQRLSVIFVSTARFIRLRASRLLFLRAESEVMRLQPV
jgi:hypothetical protein